MAAAAEYQLGGAGTLTTETHDAEPSKPKSQLSRTADEILDGGNPLRLTKDLAGTIESVQSTGATTKILIRYLNQLTVARRVARDPHFEPITAGMTGVVDGTEVWFTVTHASGGHAIAEIQGRRPVRALQSVSINPGDARLALVHSRRPASGPTWGNHTSGRESLF